MPYPKLEVRESKIIGVNGRGVFTTVDISKGTVIEKAPVIVLVDRKICTTLQDYHFKWQANSALALGYGSLYNHQDNPSVAYIPDYTNQVMVYTALRDIKAGTELTVNYGPNWFSSREEKQEKVTGGKPLNKFLAKFLQFMSKG